MKLYSPATVKQIIQKYKFHFQKNLGQNFLIDGNIVNKIVGAAGISGSDTVLEIGAGIGTLTRALAEKAKKVIVIEIDKNLLPILKETLAGLENIEIVSANALKVNFDELVSERTGGQYGSGGKPYKVVANLPYYITTPLIMHSLENRFNLEMIVIMIQKEVAERITASPGSKAYGALTLAVNYYSEPEVVAHIPNKVFMPQPDVESTVVRMKIRDEPPAEIHNGEIFFRVVRAAFGQRRKTLANNLSVLDKSLTKAEVSSLLENLGIDPGRRGETLSFVEFAKIANVFNALGVEEDI